MGSDEEDDSQPGGENSSIRKNDEARKDAKVERVEFVDHFSLGLTPSSTVTFRGARVHVYDSASRDEQFLLQEEDIFSTDGSNELTTVVTVKRLYSGSFGQALLRLTYTLAAALIAGFLFVFCFQVVLFLVLNLPVESGATSLKDFDGGLLIGTFLSLPLLLYGMSTLMAFATSFVSDTWHGGPLVQSITGWSRVTAEWLSLTVFLGIPILSICITLLAQFNNWWEMSARVWVVCMAFALAFFAIAVSFREVQTCFRIIRDSGLVTMENGDEPTTMKDWWSLLHCAFLFAQSNRYSGRRDERYMISGDDENQSQFLRIDDHTRYSQSKSKTPDKTRIRLYSRLTQLSCLDCLFEKAEIPERIYTPDEIRNVQPIYTQHNWSLEEMFCRDSRKSIVMASRGAAALRPGQAYSSLACSTLGSVLVAFFILSLLIWFNSGLGFAFLVALLCFFFCWLPMVKDSISLYRMYQSIHLRERDIDGHVVHVWETVCIAKPRKSLCYATFAIELFFCLLWPMITIISSNSGALAAIFVIVGLFSAVRIYIDASSVLSSTGKITLKSSIRASDGQDPSDLRTEEHMNQARTAEIIGKVSRSRSINRWMWIYGVFVVLIFFLFLSTLGSDLDFSPEDRPVIYLAPDFFYPGKSDLAYPTCELTKGFTLPDSVQLQDFAFLSALAYEEPNITQGLLDTWFGPGMVVDEAEFVAEHRKETGSDVVPVWFKLFSFPGAPGFGLISIRGSETSWDWLTNMQLWASSGLAQVVRAVVPFGWIWTPILDDLVAVVNSVESGNLKDVSYYKTVAEFIRDLQNGYNGTDGQQYDDLRLTGASLGGGIAGIAGAQTGVNVVAISGPGAKIPRRTFDPPVTLSQLNNHVFTVIPDRDIIVRIGGRSRLFQEIDCNAPNAESFGGCHSMWRSTCELAYQCGSRGRPAMCMCVERFGYPYPEKRSNATGSESFADICNL